MTEEDKDILIEKMIDKPETLTPDEIALISSDAELKELYEISVRLADEMTPMPEVDIDAEWMKMHKLILGKTFQKKSYFRWTGIVAGIVVLLICGGVAVRYNLPDRKSHQIIDIHYLTPEQAAYYKSLEAKGSDANDEPSLENQDKRQVSKKPCIQSPKLSDNENSDFDEYLRIEQARVDNEVAVALARVYREDYSVSLEALADILDQQSENDSCLIVNDVNEININQLTML